MKRKSEAYLDEIDPREEDSSGAVPGDVEREQIDTPDWVEEGAVLIESSFPSSTPQAPVTPGFYLDFPATPGEGELHVEEESIPTPSDCPTTSPLPPLVEPLTFPYDGSPYEYPTDPPPYDPPSVIPVPIPEPLPVIEPVPCDLSLSISSRSLPSSSNTTSTLSVPSPDTPTTFSPYQHLSSASPAPLVISPSHALASSNPLTSSSPALLSTTTPLVSSTTHLPSLSGYLPSTIHYMGPHNQPVFLQPSSLSGLPIQQEPFLIPENSIVPFSIYPDNQTYYQLNYMVPSYNFSFQPYSPLVYPLYSLPQAQTFLPQSHSPYLPQQAHTYLPHPSPFLPQQPPQNSFLPQHLRKIGSFQQ